jgi:hypothetical protein
MPRRDYFYDPEAPKPNSIRPAAAVALFDSGVYWGDLGVTFAWDGASRPRSQLLGMGAEDSDGSQLSRLLTAVEFAEVLKELPESEALAKRTGGLMSGGAASSAPGPRPVKLSSLDQDLLSDLLAAAISESVKEPNRRAGLILAADQLVREDKTRQALNEASSAEDQVDVLLRKIDRQVLADAALVSMGGSDWLTGVRDRVSESGGRFADSCDIYCIGRSPKAA